ncbi:MAG: FAD-binding protein, partial [Candidatus Methylomirabilales bacterium]
SGCHATPIDFDWPEYGVLLLTDKSNRLSYPFSPMINLDGERFADEGEDFKLYTYAKMGRMILAQRNGFAIQVFDQKAVPILEPRYSTGKPIKADTLEKLAEGIEKRYGHLGFNKEKFLQTLEEFNAAAHDGEINPTILDGMRTKGLNPEKTNWAYRISKPPFVAYAASCGITFTFGGVRINENAEVMDHHSKPIPGLYSTGEMTGGFFYHNYAAGSGLMRGAVFGRIAGENAARFTLDGSPPG